MDNLALDMTDYNAEVDRAMRGVAADIAHTRDVLRNLRTEPVAVAAVLVADTLRSAKTVYLCGNGGSAADCQHFSAEIVGRYKRERGGYAAVSLTTDTSALTAIANDYGYDSVFSRQIEALATQGDLLIAISTSGSSPNIHRAISAAQKLGMNVILLSGEREVQHEGITLQVRVPSRDTPRIQECHGLIIHAICAYLDEVLA